MGLLVGLSVGLLVLAAGSALMAQHLRGHRLLLQDSHLHQDLRSVTDWMTRELRQAQYSASSWETRSPTACTDDFCDGLEDFSILDDWIDFSHDRNHNGQQDDNECTGFRLSEQVVQTRRSCSGTGQWLALTDKASLEITALNWRLRCELRNGWLHRSVTVDLTAQWPGGVPGEGPGGAARSFSLSQTVHLRNDLPASTQALFCP